MERKRYILLLLCCCFFSLAHAQRRGSRNAPKDTLTIVKNQEGIVVIKLAICDPKHDEYCLVSQDIYINKAKHTLGNNQLVQQFDSLLKSVQAADKKSGYSRFLTFRNSVEAQTGYHNFTGTYYFASDVLARGDTWRRNKGGQMFILKERGPYDISAIYIVYKITGTFAFVSPTLSSFYDHLYDGYHQPKTKEKVLFPVVEPLAITGFSRITSKEAKRMGLLPFRLEYYRLRTAGVETVLDESEKGRRDN